MIRNFGAMILFTPDLPATSAFYEAIGLPLEDEDHGEGPVHRACELGELHFAIFEAEAGRALEHRSGGSNFFGFRVDSLDDAMDGARSVDAEIVQAPESYPWGMRALVKDPDGRVVELFQPPESP